MDYSPPGSSAHGISQGTILEWVAMPSSRDSSRPRDWTGISCIGRWVLYTSTTWEALHTLIPMWFIWSYAIHVVSTFPSKDFPGGSDGKASAYNAGDLGLIPGWGRFLGGGYGNPLQYSCLENPMGRGAWQATVHRIAKSQTWLK